MAKLVDLTGQRFGRLVVLRQGASLSADRCAHWWCICDCGNKTIVKGAGLRSGNILSCGCYRKEKLEPVRQAFFERWQRRRFMYRVFEQKAARKKKKT